MSWPGLKPHQMHNPSSYVVEGDLRDLGDDLVDRFAGELLQWRQRDGLSPTALAICAILGLFRGLRDGQDGCGVQAPIRAWAARLGRSTRMVNKAFEELAIAGLVWRRQRLVKVSWVDAGGVSRSQADVHAVAYLSKLGMVRLSRRYEKRRRGEIKRLVVKAGVESRVLVASGIVGKLLGTLKEKLRVIARRVAALPNRFRPTASHRDKEKRKTEAQRGSPVGNAVGPSSHRQTRASSNPGADPPVAGMGSGSAKLFEIWKRGDLTPATAWPDLWRPLKQLWVDQSGVPHFEPRTKKHWWLIREFEKLVRAFTKLELLGPSTILSTKPPATAVQ